MTESARDEALRLSKEAGVFLDYRLETPHHNERQVTAIQRLIALARQRPGWVWVPKEPTKEMRKAGAQLWMTGDPEGNAKCTYQAMLAAAPRPEDGK
jgi:hypothetical protein